MQLMDVRTGAKVQFITLRNGKRVGLDKEIYTIKDINFSDCGACEILVESDGYEVYTNHEAIELATDTAIKEWEATQFIKQIKEPMRYKQITIFDLLEAI